MAKQDKRITAVVKALTELVKTEDTTQQTTDPKNTQEDKQQSTPNPPTGNKKSSYGAMELYPDNKKHKAVLKSLMENAEEHTMGVTCCMILHNKDEWHKGDKNTYDPENWMSTQDENNGSLFGMHMVGEVKKPHYHVLIKFPYPVTEKSMRSWVETLGIEARFIQAVNCVVGYSMYLTHNDPQSRAEGKHQYSIDEVLGNRTLIEEPEEVTLEGFLSFLEWYIKGDELGTFTDLYWNLSKAGYAGFIKSQGYVATRMMEEAVRLHNKRQILIIKEMISKE